jgi:hypothetical protein
VGIGATKEEAMKHAEWTAPEIRCEVDDYASYDEAVRDLALKVREAAQQRVRKEEMTELEALVLMRREMQNFLSRLKPRIRFYDKQGVEIQAAQ